MISKETLLSFCAIKSEELRKYLWGPLHLEGKDYYMNGHIMVWVSGNNGDKLDQKKLPKVIKALNKFELLDSEKCEKVKFPDDIELDTCGICDGTGKATICDTCSGEGVSECNLDFEHCCDDCNGDGWIAGQASTCPFCHGYKIKRSIMIPLFGFYIDAVYLKKILDLPDVRVGPPATEKDPYLFVFDGGKGVCMGMREPKKLTSK